ncbi:zinc-binding dehydrogenase [Cellulomonas sp. SG140]|uniref:zinc-binding dehydrogenase n=1 Tax=Cellulomonas sp. SG140 TaxID=2976536 RepID=UPI0021E818C5|nr:zinc-binding dehydrogenase [Cellulomonas sp. SG140]
MLAAYAARSDADHPLGTLEVGERPDPQPRDGWTVVTVKAASLNHHDLWSLRGVGLPADRLPMILGTDAAGTTPDGREVIVHGVIGGAGAPTGQAVPADEPRSLLSERYQGTLAEQVLVPTANLVDRPAELSWEHAACLPTAYLTAYRSLFRSGGATPGQRVLVQGAGGGVATAAVVIGAAAGLEMVVTSRDAGKRERALQLGAAEAVETGARIGRVDLVLETVGAATWAHTMRSVKPGGTVVVVGATTGEPARMDINRLFFQEISVIGATMGSRDELARLAAFCARTGVRPVIDRTYPLTQAADALARLAGGGQFGKIVVTP